ncbi:MAG: DEAD/DEAH box helicase [Campylobacteraceae bacterium]|jgi:ATP-dependent RNA helicase DeaD|nr:DEAD/DEAH box helicase [Campylobacteraceae bacterium]
MNTFEDFGLHEQVLRAVKELGFKEPSPIQEQIIPLILEGRDVVGQAQTGTGKTAAFSLPSLNMIDGKEKKIQILVITPTRELATQVSDEMYSLGRYKNIHTVTVYGGSSYSRQLKLIEQGASVVVATPGRLLDLLKNNRLYGFEPKIVILDEADEMLDMGFLEDIEAIFARLPKERQTMLFSATMPEPIKVLARKILNNPAFVSVTPQNATTNADIEQQYYIIEEHERDDAVIRLLDALDPEKAIIFCRTKKEVDRLGTRLVASGFIAKTLHGDMEQPQREEVIKAFRHGDIDILVATDVAARGLNVKEITHVFNYHMPFDPESYVHRIGRTARAGQKGTAITLLTPIEYHSLQRIAKTVGTKLTQKQIPTLFEMKTNNAKKLAQSVLSANIDTGAAQIVNELEKELDLAQIAYKAISLLIDKADAKGPNSIGVDSKTFENYIKRVQARTDEKRGGRSRSRNRSTSNRSNRDSEYSSEKRGGNKTHNSDRGGFKSGNKNRSSKKGKK